MTRFHFGQWLFVAALPACMSACNAAGTPEETQASEVATSSDALKGISPTYIEVYQPRPISLDPWGWSCSFPPDKHSPQDFSPVKTYVVGGRVTANFSLTNVPVYQSWYDSKSYTDAHRIVATAINILTRNRSESRLLLSASAR
jgi:hypothetical protein